MRDIYLPNTIPNCTHGSNLAIHMTAYNNVSGVQVSENPKILKGVPRGG
jgi:beta-glucosidase-like glycosyl hydrolase